MTCQCFLSFAISVVIWFLAISSSTMSRHLIFGLISLSIYICNIFLVASSLSKPSQTMWQIKFCSHDVTKTLYAADLLCGEVTNEEELRRMGTGREIVRQFKTRKLQYLGHLIRHNSSQLQLIEGKIEGRRSRGRPRHSWTTVITTVKCALIKHQLLI